MGFSFKYTRYSAIAQITLGVLSIVFGIADRAVMYKRHAFHSESVVPIWMGVWFVITGVIGVHGSKRSNARDGRASRPLIGTYLAFSIVSTVFAAVIIIMYTIGVARVITKGSPCRYAEEYVLKAMYPSPAGAPGGGAQGGGTLDAQAPPLHPKSGDMPPVYQP
ncbi:hypothetical protein AC249_AIPGENE28702 [Exaiptasia diaphana]|nr:hypothetical protein AC249_AIPGENE28702 [Exaiptasia diaphana]